MHSTCVQQLGYRLRHTKADSHPRDFANASGKRLWKDKADERNHPAGRLRCVSQRVEGDQLAVLQVSALQQNVELTSLTVNAAAARLVLTLLA